MKSATRSHAPLSSSKPPSTDCSASTECGGTLSELTWGSFEFMEKDYIPGLCRNSARRKNTEPVEGFRSFNLAATRMRKAPRAVQFTAGSDVFADHRNRHVDHDVRMQRDLNSVLAHHLQRAVRQAHLHLLDRETTSLQGFGDVEVRDRTEQETI